MQNKLKEINSLFAQRKLEEALKESILLNKKTPNNPEILFLLGIIYNDLRRFEDAITNLTKSIKIKPNQALAHFNLAQSFHLLGKTEEAINSYKNAIKYKNDFSESYNMLGLCFTNLGKFKEATNSYKESIRTKPKQFEAYYNLGHALQLMNKDEEAIDYYKKSLKFNPNYSDTYNNLGVIFDKLGRYKLAAENFEKAIEINPENIGTINNIAHCYVKLGDYVEAIKKYDSINTNTSKAQALECLYLLKDFENINQRLNQYSVSDKKNIRIGAFSAFIANQLNQKDNFHFCANPIDFIKVSNIKSYNPNQENFINEILLEIKNINTVWEPANKTTKNGFQSNENIFEAGKIFSELKNIIKEEIISYYSKHNSENCTFINSWPYKFGLNGWFVRLIKNGYQDSHIHPEAWLSGVVYLKTIKSLTKENEGAIEFSLQGYNLPVTNQNFPKKIYKPNNGDIILFPSSLFHKTIPFTSDDERCVIAFDLVPKS